MLKKVAKNGIWLISSQALSRLIGLLYYVLVARVLSLENFGIYTFTLAFVYNFYSVADFGIERLVLKDVSRNIDKTGEYFNKLFPLRLFLSVAAIILFTILGVILGQRPSQLLYFVIFGLALVPYNLTYLIVSLENAKEKMHFMALANVSSILISISVGAFFLYLNFPLWCILSAFFWGNSIVFLIFFFNLHKLGLQLKINIDIVFWKKAIKESWVFALLTIIATFYLRTSVISLNLIKGSVETGLYGSIFKFVEGIILVPQSVAIALFPLSSRLFISDKEQLRNVYLKGLFVLLLCSLPFLFVFACFSKTLINFSFGAKFLPAVSVFPILGLAVVLFFLNSLAGNIIQNSPKVKHFLPFLFVNLILEIVLCLILIPKYSIMGAAWAVVGGEIFGLFINNLFVWKILKGKND